MVLTYTLSFHHDDPEPLVKLQEELWDPLLEWARSTFDIEIHVHRSVLFHSQPERTRQILNDVLAQMDCWEMAGTSRATDTGLGN
jgi:ATP synthase F1 complex assembly factor 2